MKISLPSVLEGLQLQPQPRFLAIWLALLVLIVSQRDLRAAEPDGCLHPRHHSVRGVPLHRVHGRGTGAHGAGHRPLDSRRHHALQQPYSRRLRRPGRRARPGDRRGARRFGRCRPDQRRARLQLQTESPGRHPRCRHHHDGCRDLVPGGYRPGGAGAAHPCGLGRDTLPLDQFLGVGGDGACARLHLPAALHPLRAALHRRRCQALSPPGSAASA